MKMIRFRCPSGHKIRANIAVQGKHVSCPNCQIRFTVPTVECEGSVNPESSELTDAKRVSQSNSGLLRTSALRPSDSDDAGSITAHETVTESGAFQLLDQIDQRQVHHTGRPPRKSCPRCKQLVNHAANVCTNCHVYLGITDKQWDRTLRNAVREVVENPLRKRH